ncbi:MAG: alpha-galactosidase [Solobacterium sp.]|nr:alpha-galactosidase [Solobacterium sp.]
MPILNYRVEYAVNGENRVLTGTHDLKEGENHIRCDLPSCTILKVTAEVLVKTVLREKIFMNGYQTWTYCPEYTRNSLIRGLHGIPKAVVSRYAFDGYGDYHFVDYSGFYGQVHGFSWCHFRNGKHIRLFASLDETPGYTIFRYVTRTDMLSIERDCSGITYSGSYPIFDLFYKEGGEQAVYDAWFEALPLKRLPAEKLYGYSSWYNRYQDINEAAIRQDLKGCQTIFEPGDLFQIDDGWEPFVGDWFEVNHEKFPNGLKPLVDEIHEKGYQAGLWLAPFVAETDSLLYQTHPEWFLLHNGSMFKCGSNWSGFYSLDIDHPEVQQYLRDVFRRIFDEWGFDLVKLDFLYGAAPYGDSHETRAGRMIRAMKFLRELCGPHPILGCGVPVMPAFGLVEYCRISCDVTLDWNDRLYMHLIHRERPSTKQAIGNTISRRLLNNRAYLSDPDVFFLRTENCRLTQEQKTMLASVAALLGGVFLTSDDPSSYTEEMKEAYRKYRHLTNAKLISVSTDDGIRIVYSIDGKRQELKFLESSERPIERLRRRRRKLLRGLAGRSAG